MNRPVTLSCVQTLISSSCVCKHSPIVPIEQPQHFCQLLVEERYKGAQLCPESQAPRATDQKSKFLKTSTGCRSSLNAVKILT